MAESDHTVLDKLNDPQHFPFDQWKTGAAHPECAEDETFLSYGNEFTFGVAYEAYETRRKGVQVIDDLGRDRTQDAPDFFPIFAKTWEHENFMGP